MPAQDEINVLNGIAAFLKYSPFGLKLGIELVEIEPEQAVLRMPFDNDLVTYGDVVHGGAIGTLIDIAATAAAWSGAEPSASPRGATVALSTHFLRAARGSELTAKARTLRRGRSLTYLEVEVTDETGALVAQGSAVYKIG